MVIDLKPEQIRVIDLAIRSGAYRDASEVISAALAVLAEEIEAEKSLLKNIKAKFGSTIKDRW